MRVIKKIIKNVYSSLMVYSGLLGLFLKFRPSRSNVAILNYHKIGSGEFEDHLKCLMGFYNIVGLDECCGYLKGLIKLKPNSVVITFDDGYEQFYHEIFPVLRKHDIPAVVFLVPSSIDGRKQLWFDRVRVLLGSLDMPGVKVGDRHIPLGRNKHQTFEEVMLYLIGLPVEERDRVIRELERNTPTEPVAPDRELLSWDQIRRMDGLITFGSHTLTHPNLSRLGREEARHEIVESKNRIQEELGHEAKFFSYPFGKEKCFTPETIEILKEARFECALTTIRGLCRQGDDLFSLKRIGCNSAINGRSLVTMLSNLWYFWTT